ncbi:MAG TPA: hypothetical protein VM791_15665 [Vicinamibacterales bacterium]|nr:hypothetical protein [Vicinamibacterales bacterium]
MLTIRSGATVTVDTLSHAGATQDEHPVSFLAKHGIAKAEVLQDVLDFWASRSRQARERRPPHILTGPIDVDGAAPGDMLEIQVLDLELRTQYGLNGSAAPSGVLSHSYPGTRPGDLSPPARQRVVRTRRERPWRRRCYPERRRAAPSVHGHNRFLGGLHHEYRLEPVAA